jgi:hypothetical protein
MEFTVENSDQLLLLRSNTKTNSAKIIHKLFHQKYNFIFVNGGRGDDSEGRGGGRIITMVR